MNIQATVNIAERIVHSFVALETVPTEQELERAIALLQDEIHMVSMTRMGRRFNGEFKVRVVPDPSHPRTAILQCEGVEQ